MYDKSLISHHCKFIFVFDNRGFFFCAYNLSISFFLECFFLLFACLVYKMKLLTLFSGYYCYYYCYDHFAIIISLSYVSFL